MGVTDWEAVSRNSVSEERLETRSLPTRSPPGTPNQSVYPSTKILNNQKMVMSNFVVKFGRKKELPPQMPLCFNGAGVAIISHYIVQEKNENLGNLRDTVP